MADMTTHTADPCLAFVTTWKAGRDQACIIGTDAFYEAHVKPLEDQAAFGTIPIATTMQGAVSALQMVFHIMADEGDTPAIEPQDANLIRAALGFLETLGKPETIGAALAAAIERHRAASAVMAAASAACKPYSATETDPARQAARDALEAAFDAVCDPWQEALEAVIAAPILSLADMRAKAAYLAQVLPGTADHNGSISDLLESMGSGGDVPVSVARGEPDPLLALIGAYRAGVEIQNAIPDEEWDEKAGAVEAEHIKPHHVRLETDPPAATSLAGVMAALQLVADENDIGDTPDLTAAVSRAALAFFDERA